MRSELAPTMAQEELRGQPPIGLIAGWGAYPRLVAEAIRRHGRKVVCVGLRGHADRDLPWRCDAFAWVGLGQLGGAIHFLRRHGVRQVAMAGKVHKVRLFYPWAVIRSLPDWTTLRTFFDHFVTSRRDRKDDTLLLAIVRTIEEHGLQVVPATDFVPEVLVPEAKLTRRGPSARQLADIKFGWNIAKEMGRLDVGQSVCVKGQAVLAVEAIEGTDACIRRAGELCPAGGFTVVKLAKPMQDPRFDVPTIGLGTLESMVRAGARVLAVEAGQTIALHLPELVSFADRHGLVLLALPSPERCPADWIEHDLQAA